MRPERRFPSTSPPRGGPRRRAWVARRRRAATWCRTSAPDEVRAASPSSTPSRSSTWAWATKLTAASPRWSRSARRPSQSRSTSTRTRTPSRTVDAEVESLDPKPRERHGRVRVRRLSSPTTLPAARSARSSTSTSRSRPPTGAEGAAGRGGGPPDRADAGDPAARPTSRSRRSTTSSPASAPPGPKVWSRRRSARRAASRPR